jgi:transposase-like protein
VKKEYQINKGQAIGEFQDWAKQNQQPVQLMIPTADVVELAQSSLGDLLRQVGKQFIEAVMEAEVEQLVGTRSQPDRERQAYRWGTEQGFCVIDSQRVPIARPRVRNRNRREVALGSYELFQRASLVSETVWKNIMHGLTMRSYKEVIQQFSEAYGLEKSTISDHFIEASRKKLELLLTRPLQNVQISVLILDGTVFKSQHLVVAIGIDRLGNKLVLGLRQGASENAQIVGDLLSELAERGLDFSQPKLYLLDGSRALRSAVIQHAGDAAFIQRCQEHKIRNVCSYLSEADRPKVRHRMRLAYSNPAAADARNLLYRLHDDLLRANPSAAASLMEGFEETLTLQELGIRGKLRQCFSTTNAIESSFSVVERICTQVKRWRGSDHRLRWVASALVYVEARWNRIHGYRQLPFLTNALDAAYQLRMREQRAAMKQQLTAA